MDRTDKRRIIADNILIGQRNYRRARDRALRRLGKKYRAEYLVLLEEEKAKDVAQSKNWITISGNPVDNLGHNAHNTQPNREFTSTNGVNNS